MNILMADTKNIEGRAYGQMLLQLPEDEAAAERIRDYLKRIRTVSYTHLPASILFLVVYSV